MPPKEFDDSSRAKDTAMEASQTRKSGLPSSSEAVVAQLDRQIENKREESQGAALRAAQKLSIEQDLQFKRQAKLPETNSRTRGAFLFGNRSPSDIQRIEQQAAAKSPGNPFPSHPDSVRSFEDVVAAKIRNEESSRKAAKDPPTTSLYSTQPDPGDIDPLSKLDKRIAAKIGINATLEMAQDPYKVQKASVAKNKGKNDVELLQIRREKLTEKNDVLRKGQGLPESAKQDLQSGPSGFQEQDLEFGVYGTEADGGLAVAMAVEEDDEDKFIPSAVEYDPDAKPPMYKNRRFRLYAFLACIVLVVAVIGAVIAFTLNGDNENEEATPELPYRETIREEVARTIGANNLENDPTGPYVKALQWITHEDPMQITPDEPNFIQRYISAYLYYATSEERPWASCNKPMLNETEDCLFDKLVKVEPPIMTQVPMKRWLSGVSECEWAGNFCNDQFQLRVISMPGNDLTGEFPIGIKHFPFLQSLNFVLGSLRGPLPPDLAEMKHLRNIELMSNQFTGTIPREWFNSRSLQRINLSVNLLTGSVPENVSELKDIKGLFLFHNLLTGSIPTGIGDLRSLYFLRLNANMIEGEIPDNLGGLEALTEIYLNKNQLTGSIPSTIGDLKQLAHLRTNSNQLTGELPDSLYNLTALSRIDIYDNKLEGTISTLIGKMPSLQVLRIKDNKFSGYLPSEIGQLDQLSVSWFSGNDFIGEIPPEVCALRINENGLAELEADCSPSPESGLVEISCPDNCCTSCCDPTGDKCFPTTKA